MFSRTSVIELVKSLKLKTHNEVEELAIKFDFESAISGQYIKEKETSIVKYLLANPGSLGPNGSNIQYELLEFSIAKYKSGINFDSFIGSFPELVNSLKKDGYDVVNDQIRALLPSQLPLVQQESELESLLVKLGLQTAKGHYEQAIAAHARGEWAAANSQLRSFVEDLFNQIQNKVCPGDYPSSQQKKQALANSGFFVSDYNEFLSNGTGFVEGFWKRLHSSGSHPGLSDELDSTFRLHMVILVSHCFLVRLDQNYL
ncbi:hypothetical protein GPM19_15015 [Halomonas sp. ZH2S]|uniref:Uncharacterized protein n=1 Tax=Vreelandella zhuhanensis TaxID=2684210 RepID=A0A7X3KRE2_9GAMM|nr:hypothetical protein [Halomonas zhuhanensis]MWJ29490.1 hypothetical protein [Halomonas zhuhanensis]